MAYERGNWQFDSGPRQYTFASLAEQSKYLLWYIKAFLTGQIGGATQGLWTLRGSSDGVTAGLDGTDRWGATFDATKIPRGAAGSAHGWAYLESPAGPNGVTTRLLLSFDGSADYVGTIVTVAGGTAISGGSTTANPTGFSSVYSGILQGQIVNNTASGTLKIVAGLSQYGDYYVHAIRSGMAAAPFASFNIALDRVRANDPFPFLSIHVYSETATRSGPLDIYAGTPTLLDYQSPNQTNAARSGHNILPPTVYLNGATPWNVAASGDPFDNTLSDLPLFLIAGNTGSTHSLRGRAYDVTIVPALPNGVGANSGRGFLSGALQESGVVTMIVMGSYAFPCNAIVNMS